MRGQCEAKLGEWVTMEYPGEDDDLQGEEGEDAGLLGEESPAISNHQVSQRPDPPLLKSSDPSSLWISV